MGLMGMFKEIFDRKSKDIAETFKGKQERVDVNLPLGLKLNSMVRIDETKFLLYGSSLKAESPGPGTHIVIGIEKFPLGDLKVYRFYLDTEDPELRCILQIPVEGEEIIGYFLYREIDEIYPSTIEEWDLWMNPVKGLIGYRDFTITEPDGTQLRYDRLWGGGEEYSQPFSFSSTIVLDPYGMKGMYTRNQGMIYARTVDDKFQEYLFIARTEVLDDYGQIKEARVDILAGIELSQAEVEALA